MSRKRENLSVESYDLKIMSKYYIKLKKYACDTIRKRKNKITAKRIYNDNLILEKLILWYRRMDEKQDARIKLEHLSSNIENSIKRFYLNR